VFSLSFVFKKCSGSNKLFYCLSSIYGLFNDKISSPDYMVWSDIVINVQLMDQMCKEAVAI